MSSSISIVAVFALPWRGVAGVGEAHLLLCRRSGSQNVEGLVCNALGLCCDFSFTKIANFGQTAICSPSF